VFEFSIRGPSIISYGLSAFAFLAFSVQLGLGFRGGLRASVLLATVIISTLWAVTALGFALIGESAFWIAQTILDAARSGGWLLFMGILLSGQSTIGTMRQGTTTVTAAKSPQDSEKSIFARREAWWAAALLALPAIAWLLPTTPPIGAWAPASMSSRLPYGFLLGVSVMGLVLAEQIFRRVREQARWSIKPLCLGLGSGFVFDLYMYADALLFGHLDANIWAARGVAQAMVIPFIALATVRNKEWTIVIAFSRGVVFHSTAFLVSGIYLLAVSAAGYYVRYFGGSWGKTFQVGFIFAALLLLGWLFSSGTLRSKVKVWINKNFFSYRYDYRDEWLRFTKLLSTKDPFVSVQQRCVEALANLVESPGGMLWLKKDDSQMVQIARWNMPEIHADVTTQDSLMIFLKRSGWVVDLEAYRRENADYRTLDMPDWLRTMPDAWLVVPIVSVDDVIGFAILAKPRTKIDINWEVLDLLKSAARQAGSFLGQIQASEALLEARKFDAFNKMSAFVVHDLKNLVAQLSLMLSNAERHQGNPEFQQDMLATVAHVVERMNNLLLQLHSTSQPADTMRPVDIGRLMKRVTAIKKAECPDISVDAINEIFVLGHETRLERVIGHLVQNAIDATRAKGTVLTKVHGDGRKAIIEIADTGTGMTTEFVKDRLFRPFQTTKSNGLGIGAYECSQYVQELGGRIHVESQPGEGTKMSVILPGLDAAADHADADGEIA
jgi:putative PEP-CTERM system histidine kinase